MLSARRCSDTVPIGKVQQLGPEGAPGSRFALFSDPDANTWAVQEYKRTT